VMDHPKKEQRGMLCEATRIVPIEPSCLQELPPVGAPTNPPSDAHFPVAHIYPIPFTRINI